MTSAGKSGDFMHKMRDAQLAERSCSQPYASEMDLLGTAVPFLGEHKLSGELERQEEVDKPKKYEYKEGKDKIIYF